MDVRKSKAYDTIKKLKVDFLTESEDSTVVSTSQVREEPEFPF